MSPGSGKTLENNSDGWQKNSFPDEENAFRTDVKVKCVLQEEGLPASEWVTRAQPQLHKAVWNSMIGEPVFYSHWNIESTLRV